MIVVLRSCWPACAAPRHGVVSFAMSGNPACPANSAASPGDQASMARGVGTPRSRQSWNIEYLPASLRGRSAGGRGNANASRSASPCSARKIAPASSVAYSTARRPIRLARLSSPDTVRCGSSGRGCQKKRPDK